MPLLPLILLCAAVLVIAYYTYGRLLSKWLGVDADRPTPACQINDGNDYVPASAPVVLGGHFTAIAAAGPVVGPIVAGLAFGWLPALLWILLGAIFIGGMHDASSLMASIRHKAASITEVVRQHMSKAAYVTFLAFVWISLVYVIIAFADVTSGTFSRLQNFTLTQVPPSAADAATALPSVLTLNGGAVAIGASAYLLLSLLMGIILRFTKAPLWICTVLSVLGLGLTIHFAPQMAQWLSGMGLSFLETKAGQEASLSRAWNMALMVYCFIASVTPMWLLLQPRGVIGAMFLYATLAAGLIGCTLAPFLSTPAAGQLTIHWPAYTGFTSAQGQTLFPFLFILIACGACSGFHAVVASGTTSKQLKTEKHIRPVAYGAMLLEAMVAVFALACVMMLQPGTKAASPDAVYAMGIGKFLAVVGIPLSFAVAFGLLAFSSFVFDTLDVCTRLGRYVLQEMLGLKGLAGSALATLITLAAPAIYLYQSQPGSFRTFWTLFGTSNQLLAALTLVGVSVWLWRTGRPVLFALIPAGFMLVTTFYALVLNFNQFLAQWRDGNTSAPINVVIAVLLLLLAGLVVIEAARVYVLSKLRPVPAT